MTLGSINWYFGWCLLLSGFVTGAAGGLFFHREEFLGGYPSFRRRLFRLGHISQAALGMMNVLYGLTAEKVAPSGLGLAASLCFILGGLSMPLVCFLTGWHSGFRRLFPVPVAALMLAVLFTLRGGPP
jgi:hypothetical protein